jgi:type II secretory pathway component PulL
METLDDNPAKITATHRARNRAALAATHPDLWISPFAYQSFAMVDAACDRWLKRRAAMHKQRDERAAADLPAAHPADDVCHSSPRKQ